MCGRYALTLSPAVIRAAFGYADQPNFPPRYNIAPTQPVAAMRLDKGADGRLERRFVLMRWGFIPGFVKDPKGFTLIVNARSESARDKPSFRNALRRRRCIFLADAFYEWRVEGKRRRPFMVRRPTAEPFGMGGLWETWSSPDGGEIDTSCILTTSANGTLAAVHERMPVILDPADYDAWLDCDRVDADMALLLARPAPEDALDLVPIGDAVNKVANDGPGVQEKLADAAPPKAVRDDRAPRQGSLF